VSTRPTAWLVVHSEDGEPTAFRRDLTALGYAVLEAAEGERSRLLAAADAVEVALVRTPAGPGAGGDLVARLEHERRRSEDLLHAVIPLGVSLLSERNFDRLLETILCKAKELCRADGGTLYLRGPDETLTFVMVRNDSLGITMGGTSGTPVPFAPLPLRDSAGTPNHHNVATYAALTGETVNIADAYDAQGFDFAGTKRFDGEIGYRSTSFLTVPLKGAGGTVIGVLQLINAQDPESARVIPFDPHGLQPLVESLSLLAAAALEAYAREASLTRQIRELHIQIDEAKKAQQVAEIADTDYFQQLQSRARELRKRD
jgi:hypothetical protein